MIGQETVLAIMSLFFITIAAIAIFNGIVKILEENEDDFRDI